MSANYDPVLPSDKDWVRFLIGDKGLSNEPSSFTLSNEEIEAVLGEEANKYLAAARCGEAILSQGRDVVSKSVGNLSISYGSSSPESAYRHHLTNLREKGCRLLLDESSGEHGGHSFRML